MTINTSPHNRSYSKITASIPHYLINEIKSYSRKIVDSQKVLENFNTCVSHSKKIKPRECSIALREIENLSETSQDLFTLLSERLGMDASIRYDLILPTSSIFEKTKDLYRLIEAFYFVCLEPEEVNRKERQRIVKILKYVTDDIEAVKKIVKSI